MIDSGTVSKIQKARQYAEERDERIRFSSFTIEIEGENNHHITKFDRGTWDCDCEFFHTHSHCSHTMAMERVLGAMLSASYTAAREA